MADYRKVRAREYWAIAALMCIVIAGSLGLAGNTLRQMFSFIGAGLTNVTPSA
jgi:Flp pilus assembly pilin Flp